MVRWLKRDALEKDEESTSTSESDEVIKGEGTGLSAVDSRSLELATARLLGDLRSPPHEELRLERDSVYGAAILLPQLARSAGWPKSLTVHAIRTFIFLFGNLFLQGVLIMHIAKEQAVYDAYGGQMYLCDFREGSKGPLGTVIDTPKRLYADFSQWNTRVFVRDSLLSTFPEHADRIREQVDPGEYGIESRACRSVCALIYVMATLEEFYLILHLLRLLWCVPTRADPWMTLSEADVDGKPSFRSVTVQVAGIPLFWKVVYFLLVLLPKVLLWKMTMETGFTYIMDTAQISDLIVNAVALGFILTIDELVCSVFFTDDLKDLLQSCKSYPMSQQEEHAMSDNELLESFRRQRGLKAWRTWDVLLLLPPRVVVALLWFAVFTAEYYWRHCQWSPEDRTYVSRTVYTPASSRFSLINFALPNFFPVDYGKPFWSVEGNS